MIRTVEIPIKKSTFGSNNIDIFNKDFKVKINGQEVTCYNSRCSAIPFNRIFDGNQRNINQSELLGHVSFEADESVIVEVECEKQFSTAIVRPLSKGIATKIDGKKVTFTLDKVGQYVLELDDEHTCLNLFFNPVNDFKKKEEYNYYFEAGIHYVGELRLKDGDKVYIDKDAMILGAIYAESVSDILIEGYGTINGKVLARNESQHFNRGNIMLINCKNIVINGPILVDASYWVAALYNCENIEINNIKITGQWRYNTDGIDLVSCRNAVIKDSFVHAFDDVIVIKAYSLYEKYTIDVVENIMVDNCVLWCGWGRTIEIGIETAAKEYKNITFKNCDLIHNSAVAIDIQNGNNAFIHDVVVKDSNVEFQKSTMPEIYQETYEQVYDGYGKIGMPYFVWIDNHRFFGFTNKMFSDNSAVARKPEYDDAETTFGSVEDVLIDNVNIYADEGLPNFKIKVRSVKDDVVFDNITISNVLVNGEKVVSAERFDMDIDERIERFII